MRANDHASKQGDGSEHQISASDGLYGGQYFKWLIGRSMRDLIIAEAKCTCQQFHQGCSLG
eukprot:NODE_544_length_1365_cov_162.276596_g420_i0.p8 GENE.NODE_544_length_1365_cov_162.276596_g420_i0~~NODE_544_length_1365_cov_162.276596_g420_i0.p8  ORF type:complete len:61 (-),score=10.23 NODE_544_length_1365_cov_162.276596_g420_i0:966-1148(-)